MTDNSITDGKRSVTVSDGKDGIDITICRNGFQSVVVTLDTEMVSWLASMISPGWQPIETAPKDGTRIIVGNEYGTWVAEYCPVYESGWTPENSWFSVMLNHNHMPRRAPLTPTHWMPMPEPPGLAMTAERKCATRHYGYQPIDDGSVAVPPGDE